MSTNPTNSEPDEPTSDEPIESHLSVTPGESVSFEVPANTNLVINVVSDKPKGLLESLFSGLGCLFTGLFWLAVIFWVILWITP